jgi:hypothetical protein
LSSKVPEPPDLRCRTPSSPCCWERSRCTPSTPPNPELELFFVTVEALEESPTPINIGIGRGDGFRRFIFPPIAADSIAISPLSLAHYGLHQVRVYHVNTEYAALYESRQQDTRDLNEPATNIRNGLGVFSAFGSRTVLFRAVAAE